MTALITDTSDLSDYLGVTVNADRGYLLLELAQSLCESVVSPLPAGAKAVVLSVAGRAYTNVSNAQSQTVGPFNAAYSGGASGGLYLSRQDKATLRRLAGTGGAFTINMISTTAGASLPWWGTDNGGLASEDWDLIP